MSIGDTPTGGANHDEIGSFFGPSFFDENTKSFYQRETSFIQNLANKAIGLEGYSSHELAKELKSSRFCDETGNTDKRESSKKRTAILVSKQLMKMDKASKELKAAAETCNDCHLLQDLDIPPKLKKELISIEKKSDDTASMLEHLKKLVNDIIENTGNSEITIKDISRLIGSIKLSPDDVPPRLKDALFGKTVGDDSLVAYLNNRASSTTANLAPTHDLPEDSGVYRTPLESAIHFLSEIKSLKAETERDFETLSHIREGVKEQMLLREITPSKVRSLFDSIIDYAKNRQLSSSIQTQLENISANLKELLPPEGSKYDETRMHDNIYGRALDSFIVEELVNNPPLETQVAISKAANTFSTYMNDVANTEKGAEKIRDALEHLQDQISMSNRSWQSMASPHFQNFLSAKNDEERLRYFTNFLSQSPPLTGVDCVAAMYLMVKSVISTKAESPSLVPWMKDGDQIYANIIMKHRGSGSSLFTDKYKKLSSRADITLDHQPAAVIPHGYIDSLRPVSKGKRATDLTNEVALKKMLEHGMTYSVGLSGSTNIALYTLDFLNNQRDANVDPKAFLIGTMMFLTHDGGHSIHEALWTAHLLQEKLNIDFGLHGHKGTPEDYVSTIDNILGSEQLEEAISRGVEKTVDHFDHYSVYRRANTPPLTDIPPFMGPHNAG